MLLGIDHLVIAVHDPDAAAADLERVIGLAFTGGGRHEAAGTFNRLAFLGDSYIELIGVFDRARAEAAASFPVARAALDLLRAGAQGLATFALATDDVGGDVDRLVAAGSPIGEPVAGMRVRPDGDVVRWITAFPALAPDGPPFLIEHDLRGAEWGDAARAARAAFRHPVGGRARLAGVDLAVADPERVANRYQRVIGVRPVADGTGGALAIVGGQEIRLRGKDGMPPVVDLVAEPGSPAIDRIRFGVRWRRRPGARA